MTILVTGPTGLLGNNIVRTLLAADEEVRVLCRKSSKRRPVEGLNVETVVGDVTDRDSVRSAVVGCSCVIHSAADVRIGRTRVEDQRRVNLGGTRKIAEAARAAGARLVHVSTVDTLSSASSVDHPVNEQSPVVPKSDRCGYVITKIEAETAVRKEIANGLNASIIHPGFMLGPWDWKPSSGRMLLEVARGKALFAPRGGMSVCDARDVANAVVSAAQTGQSGRNYILAGYNMTYLDAWKKFASVCEARAPIGRAGPILLKLAGTIGDAVSSFRRQEAEVNSAAIQMSGLFHYYDSTRAKNELGYNNRPLETTIAETWKWLRENQS